MLDAMHPIYMMARTKETTGPQELGKNIMVFEKFSLGTSLLITWIFSFEMEIFKTIKSWLFVLWDHASIYFHVQVWKYEKCFELWKYENVRNDSVI